MSAYHFYTQRIDLKRFCLLLPQLNLPDSKTEVVQKVNKTVSRKMYTKLKHLYFPYLRNVPKIAILAPGPLQKIGDTFSTTFRLPPPPA